MKKFKIACLFLLILFILSACHSSNEDPTNIELEVLRASLLEKEFYIDELKASIDAYQEESQELQESIFELENQVTELKVRNENLLSKQEQIIQVASSKEHYYQTNGDNVFMLFQYEDLENEYHYEELYLFAKGEKEQLVHRSSQIEFLIHEEEFVIVVEPKQCILYDLNMNRIAEIDLETELLVNAGDLFLGSLRLDYDNALAKQKIIIPIHTQTLEAILIIDYTTDSLEQNLFIVEDEPTFIDIENNILSYQLADSQNVYEIDLNQ
ncbi:MAG: hypothetical protein JW708_03360 [Vallitaleaceae bacterium]|nr:hypothetical protein [Vallitaleaceae bacterium]